MRRRVALLLIVTATVAMLGRLAFVTAGTTTCVSVDSSGNQGNDNSYRPSISPDGRYVAFSSLATTLVPYDTNGHEDVFVHDRQTGATERVSVNSAGDQGNDASEMSFRPSISADGRYVAFFSLASNLVSGDTNGTSDVFVHDSQTGITQRVSVNSQGDQGNGQSGYPAVSWDGRYVAFQSWASNLVPGDTNEAYDVFVHDRQTGITRRVSVDSRGNQGNGNSEYPAISADGSYVAFHSWASDLVEGDTNICAPHMDGTCADVFVHDLVTETTKRVSVDSEGNQANDLSLESAISGDGRYVAFMSVATNLVPDDTNNSADVFVHNRQTGVTERVSVDSAGNQGHDGSYEPAVSSDGRYVAFFSLASNLVADDSNRFNDIFIHDRQTGATQRVSEDYEGNPGNGESLQPAISGDGRYLAFYSYSTNLGSACTDGNVNVFVYDRLAMPVPTPSPVATNTPIVTPMPTPRPPGVGGTALLPPAAIAAESGASAEDSGSAAGTRAAVATAVAAMVTVGGWYARRRWRAR